MLATSRAHRLDADRLAASRQAPASRRRWPAEVHPAFVIRLLQQSREHEPEAGALRRSSTPRWPPEARPSRTRFGRRGGMRRREQAFMSSLIGSLAAHLDVRLDRVLRERQPRRAGPAPRSGRRVRPDGLPEPRSLSPRGRGNGRADGRRAAARALKAVERARQVAERTPERAGRARRLSPDRRRATAVRTWHRVDVAPLASAGAASVLRVTRRRATSARSLWAPACWSVPRCLRVLARLASVAGWPWSRS